VDDIDEMFVVIIRLVSLGIVLVYILSSLNYSPCILVS